MLKSIQTGDVKLVLCFAFYLAWWIVGFNPKRPIRGLKSGWLLIPAAMLGVLAMIDVCRGLKTTGGPVPPVALLAGGAVSYAVLLGVTRGLLSRPVTSELLIIVLWTTVMLLEANSLVAYGSVSPSVGLALAALCLAGAVASLVCYQLFYGLKAEAAFVDGTIPLLIACAVTGVMAMHAG